MSRKKLVLILILAAFIAYFSSLGNPFIWDDEQFITSNQYVQTFDIGKIFTTSTTAGAGVVSNYYRPLTTLSFAIDKAIWSFGSAQDKGQNPFGYHLTNLSLHIGAGVLLFLFLEELFGLELSSLQNTSRQADNASTGFHSDESSERAAKNSSLSDPPAGGESKGWNDFLNPAFWISLFFLIHPVQVEAVSYINSRGDSLYTFFLFGALLLFQKAIQASLRGAKGDVAISKQTGLLRYARNDVVLVLSSPLLYIASILSKETAMAAFPLFFLIVGMNMFKTHKKFPQSMQLYAKSLIVASLTIVTVSFYWILRLTSLNFENTLNYYGSPTLYSTHLWIRLFTFAKVLWVYIGILLLPYLLHMERSVSIVTSFWSPWVLGALGLFGLLGVLGILQLRKQGNVLILLGLAWFLIMLLPVSGIIPINGILYEHWLYVPMIGFWIMIYGMYQLFTSSLRGRSIATDVAISKQSRLLHFIRNDGKKIVISFALLLSTLYIVLTIRQNNIWSDVIGFYEYTIRFAPDSARLHNNLGMSLADKGEIPQAIEEYQKALSLGLGYPQIYNNLGNAEIAVGEYKDAKVNLEKALALSPELLVAKENLVKLYLVTKDYKDALQESDNNPQVEQIIQQLKFSNK